MFLIQQTNHAALSRAFAIAVACSAFAIGFQPSNAQTATAPVATPTTSPAGAALPPATPGWYGVPGERKVVPPPREMTRQELDVVERATARRQLLAKGEYKAAYEFLSPSSRSFKPFDVFEGEAVASALRDVKATRADCDKDGRCSVTLLARAVMKQPKVGDLGVPISLQEVWIAQASGNAQLILR